MSEEDEQSTMVRYWWYLYVIRVQFYEEDESQVCFVSGSRFAFILTRYVQYTVKCTRSPTELVGVHFLCV